MFSSFLGPSNEAPPPYSSQQSNNETSLTTILPSPAHRLECAVLILLCTDSMRKTLAATFELPEKYSSASSTTSPANEDLISFDPPGGARVDAQARARARLNRERELASPQVQNLQRAALAYFDTWRGKVLRRVCDALGVRAEQVRQARKQDIARRQREGNDLLDAQNQSDARSTQYPAISTRLATLDSEKRFLLLECLVLLLLSLESYPAHSRILLLHVTSSLLFHPSDLVKHESQIAHGLLEAASQMSAEESRKARAAEDSAASKWKIGIATVAGAALIGVTGGLAAPLLAAGLGTVFGGLGLGAVSGLLGALAGNTLLIGGLFGAYGGKMTGKMMERYEKEVEDFKFLPIRGSRDEENRQQLQENAGTPTLSRQSSGTGAQKQHKLRVAIGISGSLTTESDMITPWFVFDHNSLEPFALRWEIAALLRLGVSLSTVLRSYAWQYAKWEIARRTLFGALAAGLWPLGLLKLARVIDNPFSVARARADKAGMVLADALIAKCQGERPVTLVGYSVGARVIYSCLLELAHRNAFGLVENVVLVGSPVPSDSEPWTKIRSIVCGRVVNVFSTEDYILGFLYRASSAQFDVAGLQPIDEVQGVENYDVSTMVSGHTKYRAVIGQILQKIGLEDVDAEEVDKEVAILRALESEEMREERNKSVDAEAEAAEIESRIRARVGSPASEGIVMFDIDEEENRRRQEILHASEEMARSERWDAPPSYEASNGAVMYTGGPSTLYQSKAPISSRNDSSHVPEPENNDHPLAESSTASISATAPRNPSCIDTSLTARTEELRITPRVEVEDLTSDIESVASEPLGDMADIAPEPIPDDDEHETADVRSGPQTGF